MNDIITQFRFSDSDQPQHNHYHLSCELILVLEGTARFVVDGVAYLAESGSLVFVNSFEQHEVSILKTPYRRFFLTINSVEVERFLSYSTLSSIFKNRPSGFQHCIGFEGEGRAELFRLFESLYREYLHPEAYSAQMMRNLFEQLLIQVYRACPGNFAVNENGSANRIAAIQKYIEEHFTEEIRIADLAKQFFISPYYLSHTFKSQVGYSPKQYIQLNRLSYAKELLETTDLQVSQIAYKCGFGDTNNFIRSFKSWFNQAPNRYRLGEEEPEAEERAAQRES